MIHRRLLLLLWVKSFDWCPCKGIIIEGALLQDVFVWAHQRYLFGRLVLHSRHRHLLWLLADGGNGLLRQEQLDLIHEFWPLSFLLRHWSFQHFGQILIRAALKSFPWLSHNCPCRWLETFWRSFEESIKIFDSSSSPVLNLFHELGLHPQSRGQRMDRRRIKIYALFILVSTTLTRFLGWAFHLSFYSSFGVGGLRRWCVEADRYGFHGWFFCEQPPRVHDLFCFLPLFFFLESGFDFSPFLAWSFWLLTALAALFFRSELVNKLWTSPNRRTSPWLSIAA